MTGTMPQRRPRKERKENADRRRRQLLDATRRSIAACGLQRTTFDTVADQAGLSRSIAGFYFKSKTGLLAETQDATEQHQFATHYSCPRCGQELRGRR